MANKSIIDIEINDSSVQQAFERFKKYREHIGKLPKEWQKAGESASKAAGNFDEAVTALNNAAEAMNNLVEQQSKANKEQDNLNKKVKTTEGNFQRLRGHVVSISQTIAGTTLNVMKWAAATATLGATGGYFMMGGLASSASDTRRQALGLGVTPGQLKSMQVNYGRYGDVDAMLGAISGAQTDVQKQWAFQALGLNTKKTSAQMLPDILQKAGEVYKAGPAELAQQRLEVTGLTQLGVTPEMARMQAQITPEERAKVAKRAAQDEKMFAMNDKLLQQWQDLDVQLSRSKEVIQTSLIRNLSALTGPIEKLSEAFSNAVDDFVKSGLAKEWIDSLASGVKDFAKYLSSSEFKRDRDDFLENLRLLKQGMGDFAESLNSLLENIPGTRQNAERVEFDRQHELYESQQKLAGLGGKFAQYKVDPALQKALEESGLSKFVTSGVRTEQEEAALRHHQDPRTGKWVTKEGYPVTQPGVHSRHEYGQAVDISRKELDKWSDEDLARHGLYRPYKNDPVHVEMIKKQPDKEVMPPASKAKAADNSGNASALLNWNPTPIRLDVGMTKIPGMDTNVNLLTAGGYYTNLGVAR